VYFVVGVSIYIAHVLLIVN